MGDYSSFYKYEKFEVVGDELISLGIFSVDADGTMPLVFKEECDRECGCPEPIYQWVQTEDTVCIEVITRTITGTPYCNGYDKYVDVTTEESIDSGETWEFVSSSSTLVEADSPDCGYVAPPKFTLTLNDSSTVSAECDSTSTITSSEVATLYSGSVVSAVIGDCVTRLGNANYLAGPFRACKSLTSVTLSDSVKYINAGAFQGCSGLTSITIPSSVMTIGSAAFESCSGLTTFTMPNSVTTLGEGAFDYCSGLTSINISTGVTTIQMQTFYYCTSLTSITIPSNVTRIKGLAFGGCSGLTSITCLATTPPTLDRTDAFWNTNDCPIYVPCSSVSAYQAATNWSDLASRIEGIPPCSQPTPSSPKFTLALNDSSTVSAECDSTSAITSAETSDYSLDIISATIGDCVTTIGDEAFYNCMTLTSVTIPNSVTTIGDNAFNGCDLHEINLPNTLINLGDGAFKYCQYLQDVDIPVGYVPNECFSHCPNLKDVDFSLNTTTIDFGAFSSCYSLESIDIPSAIESINYEAFKDCENLASVYVHATTPPTLRNDSFDGTPIADGTGTIYVPCSSVSAYQAATNWSTYASRIQGIPPCGQPIEGKYQLTLSDSSIVTAACDSTSAITSGEVATQYSGTVVSAEIGDCVTSIGRNAFRECASLTSVTIPNSVTSISGMAFDGCSGLTSVTIPDSVTRIGNNTFDSCTSLTSITIPSGVTSIGGNAFANCYSLTSVNMLNSLSLTIIGDSAFRYCSGLTSVTIPNGVTTIGQHAFENCSFSSITIPSGVTSIHDSTFRNCSGLTSVTIPNGVTRIDQYGFYQCTSLTGITIGNGVTSIGYNAFRYCVNLTGITCLALTPPTLGSVAFDDTNNCPIYVPSGSVNDYKAVWSNYSSRIQAIP